LGIFHGRLPLGHHQANNAWRLCSNDAGAEVHFSGGPVMAKWFVPPIVIPAGFIVMVVVMGLLRHSF
jgi:hypothetical protein